MSKKTEQAADYLKAFIKTKCNIGIILGSGLGEFTRSIENIREIPYSDIPGFPLSTVDGHSGNFIFGEIHNTPVIALQGRLHVYEGHNVSDTVFPIHIMKRLGVNTLIISNASGGLNPDFRIGDIMIIEDHINLSWDNPLRGFQDGKNNFIDMSAPYNKAYIKLCEEISSDLGIKTQKGVYAGVKGPCYETPSEYNYLRIIGADAVGMSTVNEVIIARKLDMDCLAFSVISDLGVIGKIVPISHNDVLEEASKAEPELARIILEFIKKLTAKKG